MKLSTRSRYGTRILLELSRRDVDKPVQVSEISKQQGIPAKYLEQLIRILKKAGFITSVRGPKGGHIIAKNPSEITLGQLVRLFEGQTELVACISKPEKCDMADDCKVRLVWMRANKALYEILDGTTLEDIIQTDPSVISLYISESPPSKSSRESCRKDEEASIICPAETKQRNKKSYQPKGVASSKN